MTAGGVVRAVLYEGQIAPYVVPVRRGKRVRGGPDEAGERVERGPRKGSREVHRPLVENGLVEKMVAHWGEYPFKPGLGRGAARRDGQ